jgi:hypothetical protein
MRVQTDDDMVALSDIPTEVFNLLFVSLRS